MICRCTRFAWMPGCWRHSLGGWRPKFRPSHRAEGGGGRRPPWLPLPVLVLALAFVPAPAASSAAPVGYAGCSNTLAAVRGYSYLGGTRFWGWGNYMGGTILRWGVVPSSLWYSFDYLNRSKPGAQQVWLNVCVKAGDSLPASQTAAVKVVAEIRRRIPGATVYVSPLARYPDHLCSITGMTGVPASEQISEALVAAGLAQRGPTLPDLTRSTTAWDRCHPNTVGMQLLGRALLGWYG